MLLFQWSTRPNVSFSVAGCAEAMVWFLFVIIMFSTFPNYNPNDEDGCASFTTVGALSWVGEGCSVEKNEQPLSL